MAKDSTAVKQKGGNKIVKYCRDLKSEIKKVVWPSRSQVVNNTGIVLILCVICGLVLAGIDLGLSQLVKLLLGIK